MSRGGKIVFACLLALLVLAVATGVLAWGQVDDGQPISLHGIIALVLGGLGSLVVGGGLMALVFFSNRSGHDQAVHDETRQAWEETMNKDNY
jgi:predicted exporter